MDPAVSHFVMHEPFSSARLDSRLVRNGRDALWDVVLQADSPCLPRGDGHALEGLGVALLLGLLGLRVVLLDALEEVLAGAGQADVLNADVDALLHVSVADLAVAVTALDFGAECPGAAKRTG